MFTDDHVDQSESYTKKRKWDDVEVEEILPANHRPWIKKSLISDNIDLQLETPLPSEWQSCLDIQSGEIHFYNTETHKKTTMDPRKNSPESSSLQNQESHMSLDLELNLPCSRSFSENSTSPPSHQKNNNSMKNINHPSPDHLLISLNSIANHTDYSADEEVVEMVATACMKCHMLVMLCKSSPTCPNCKFMHPPYQTPPDLLKSRLSLSC